MLSETTKTYSQLTKELQETSQTLQTISIEQSKLNALHKHLNQFEKEWAKTAKKMKAQANAAKVKAKAKAKTRSKPKKLSTQPTQPSITETPKIETFDTIESDIRLDETNEVTS